jgi:AraC-like DNA-binding protein
MSLLKRKDFLTDAQLPLEIRRAAVRRDTAPDHAHEFIEMVLVIGGVGTHVYGSCAYPIARGDLFVISSERTHSYAGPRELEVLLFLFDEAHFVERFPALPRLSGYQGFFHLEPSLRAKHRRLGKLRLDEPELSRCIALAETIVEEKRSRREGYALRSSSLFASMLVEVCRAFVADETHASRELRRLGDLMSVIEERLDEPWSLEGLASLVHVSRSTLIRYFRRATGKTPVQYLTDVRLSKARSLLSSTDLSVCEIARRSGFAEGNYLARTFKARTKLTPTEFRRRARTR